jgi:hypothetical protein
MTTREARELHNPFIRDDKLCRETQVNCKSFSPDLSLLKREAVMLTFPNQEWIDLVSKVQSITSLFLDRPRAPNLSPLTSLNLKNLTTSYPSHVKDWSFLEKFSSLLRLSLHNTLSIQDLEPIRDLVKLEVIQLSGGYSKALRLLSLAPLANLKNLKVIDLAAVRFSDWSLSPLFQLSDLRRFDCPLNYPKEELSALKSHNPKLESNAF